VCRARVIFSLLDRRRRPAGGARRERETSGNIGLEDFKMTPVPGIFWKLFTITLSLRANNIGTVTSSQGLPSQP
jgi:hypothetical protein